MTESDSRQAGDAGQRRGRHAAYALLALVAVGFALGVMMRELRCTQCQIPPSGVTPRMPERLDEERLWEAEFRARNNLEASHLRWMDAGDVAYAETFRSSYSYDDADVRVRYDPGGEQLRGRIIAQGLKPWFVYQLKLVGDHPLLGVRAEDNDEPGARSSWAIGQVGRWWCEQCQCNVPDAELGKHLACCHEVRGYLLFDWFMTDGAGNADHYFVVDRSLHVLWKVGQRTPGPHDTPPRWYRIQRSGEAYSAADQGGVAEVGVYGEWEPGRPRIGRVQLCAGEYPAWFNLTEESWHANMPGRESALGGYWAWVMDADIRFWHFSSLSGTSRDARPGCLLGLGPRFPLARWRGDGKADAGVRE